MRTLGLIGGMSWESTALYYQNINALTRARRGGLHSAPLVIWSFDFADIEAHQAAGDWATAGRLLGDAASKLETSGASGLVLCTNTMHRLASDIERRVEIPLLHIADATAGAIKRTGCRRPLLLGTRYTMEQDFYRGRLEVQHDLSVAVPDEQGRQRVHNVIYNELCQGVITDASKAAFLGIINDHHRNGIDGVILGCTEIGLLVKASDLSVPVFDTTEIHAAAAVDFALEDVS